MIFEPLAASCQQEGPASNMCCLGREVEGADGGSIKQTQNLQKEERGTQRNGSGSWFSHWEMGITYE